MQGRKRRWRRETRERKRKTKRNTKRPGEEKKRNERLGQKEQTIMTQWKSGKQKKTSKIRKEKARKRHH